MLLSQARKLPHGLKLGSIAYKSHRIDSALKGASNNHTNAQDTAPGSDNHTNAQDTAPGSDGRDETALVDTKSAGLLISLAPEPKAVDLHETKHVSSDKAQRKYGERSEVAALDVSNAPPQSISQNDCDMEANCKRGVKRNLSHSLVAKLRKLYKKKKLSSWNWKHKGHKQRTTEVREAANTQQEGGEAAKPQQEAGKATMESESSCENDRQDWEAIRAISNDRFRHLLLRCLNQPGKDPIRLETCIVAARLEGGFHLAVVIYVLQNRESKQWIIKVPAHGTARFWTEQDTYKMRREIEIMQQISFNTEIPVPEIKGFYTGLDDEFGAPWVVMEMLPGKPAHSIWFDEPYSRETAYLGADSPTAETHRRRVNFLKSLAEQMVKLQRMKFDQIGMAKIQYPHDVTHNSSDTCEESPLVIGPAYYWPDPVDITRVVERGPFPTTQDFIQSGFQALFDLDMLCEKYPEANEKFYAILGASKIMKAVFNTAAFNPECTDETFAIRHDDLNFQNILVDNDGNVTGIIDWDGAYLAPRCIGPAAAPLFLSRDWLPEGHGEQLEKIPHMAWNTGYYRKLYAAVMHKAELEEGISHDAQYTTNSALYQAALCAIYEGGDVQDFTEKILQSLPGFMMDPCDFRVLLGRGFPAAEDMLEREITKLCKPTLPEEEYMKEVEEHFHTDKHPWEMDLDVFNDIAESLMPLSDTVKPLKRGKKKVKSSKPVKDTVNPLTPDDNTVQPLTPDNDTVPGKNNKAQDVLPSASSETVQEDDNETELLYFMDFRSMFSQASSSNESPPCSSLGIKDGGHLQTGSQLQSHPNVKPPIFKMKVPTHLSGKSYIVQSSSGEHYLIKALGKATEGAKAAQLPIPAIDIPKREG